MTGQLQISDIAEVLRGTVPANTVDGRSDAPGFFGLAEITNSGIVTRSPEPGTDLSSAIALKRGDVVVALLGKLGEVAVVTENAAGSVLGRECAALRLKRGEDRLDPRWLFVAMRSAQVRESARLAATGSTMPRLNVRTLGGFTIPVPTRDMQLRILERLDALEQAIQAQAQLLGSLNRLLDVEIELSVASVEVNKESDAAPVAR
jgi:restriction endonuclease S subunit